MPLFDYLGRPITPSELTKEHAAPSIRSIRGIFKPSVASGLTPQRLARVLKGAEQPGGERDYFNLAAEMERREPHYSSVLGTRKRAVVGLQTHIEAIDESEQEEQRAEVLRNMIKRRNFKAMMTNVLDAIGKGCSFVEIDWDTSGEGWSPRGYVYRDPAHFRFDQETGNIPHLLTDENPADGEPLEPFKFIYHEHPNSSGRVILSGLAYLVAVLYMAKSYTLRDWMAFAEIFGLPLRIGRYGDNATDDDVKKLITAIRNLGSDAGAVIPESMQIDFEQMNNVAGGQVLFKNMAEFWNHEISKAVIGQTMTTEDGSSHSQAEVHDGVRMDIVMSDAELLAATIQRDLIDPTYDLNWGPPPSGVYPVFSIIPEDEEDLKLLSEALPPFIDRGLKIRMSDVRDKFGFSKPDDDDEILGGKPEPAAPPPPAPGEPQPDDSNGDGSALNTYLLWTAINQQKQPDLIDEMVGQELDGWRAQMDPIIEPLINLAKNSETFEEFRAGIDEAGAEMNSQHMMDRLAVSMMKVRGLGNGSDSLDGDE